MLEAEGFRVQPFDSARAFLDGHDGTTDGCLLLDIDMPEMDGLELQEELNRREIFIPIIILTAHGNVPLAVQTLRSGAVDFVEKPFDEEDLIQRIHGAIARNLSVEVNPAERAVIQQRLVTLSDREKEILELVVAGKWIKIIASELGTSPNTVRNQRSKILDKMQADSVPDLVRMVMISRTGQ
jgi:two-component system response regulator FixJ